MRLLTVLQAFDSCENAFISPSDDFVATNHILNTAGWFGLHSLWEVAREREDFRRVRSFVSSFLKEKFLDFVSFEDLYHGIRGLEVAMKQVALTSVHIPHTEDNIEKFPFETLRNSIILVFDSSGTMFTLCSGGIQVLPQDSKKEIVKVYHT